MNIQSKILASITVISLFLFSSCEKGIFAPKQDINDPDSAKGEMSISITDAPIDDANVSAAFVTVTQIKVDGKVLEGFSQAKTVNVLALQNGNSATLFSQEVAAGTYSKIELVFDAAKDENGNAPGCYIQSADGSKEALTFDGKQTAEVSFKKDNFKVAESGKIDLVVDFDLRKAVKNEGGKYSFVSDNKLSTAVRSEVRSETGNIKGKIENKAAANGDLVVYVYKKGTFNAESETKGSDGVKFPNAVTSAMVQADGSFTLAFLPKGEYEIQCEKASNQGGVLTGLDLLLQLESSSNIESVPVTAGSETSLSLNIKVGGLLGL